MPIEIRMPRLTDTMTEGAVVSWRKRDGEPVRAGEVIAEIEADKTTVDLEAPEDGTLAGIAVPAGAEKVAVGQILALLRRPGEAAAPVAGETGADAPVPPPRGNGHPAQAAAHGAEPAEAAPAPTTPRAEPAVAPAEVEVKASPLARSMARQAGIDLASLRGSGPQGHVVKADVLAALGSGPGGPEAAPAPPHGAEMGPEPARGEAPYDEVPHSRMRVIIARRLGESKRTIPHFYLAVNCRVDALLRVRAELQPYCEGGLKLTLNDFAIRAAALTLRKVPEANTSWTDAAARRYRRIDLAVAVATEAGLIAPVVRDADRKGLAELAAELRDLAARARAGRLRPEEYQGGTFTVSNLGMYGIDEFYPIVNPPQAGILGLGAAGPRPVARDGAVVIATMMTCTLSADHRALDGAAGARFLATFKTLIEQPTTMIL